MVGGGTDLSAGEAARLLGYGRTQVHRIFDRKDGTLPGYETDGGHRRIYAAGVARLLLQRPPDPRWEASLAELRELGVDVDAVARDLG